MTPPPTKSGTRKLSEVARKIVVPTGIVSTGWPAVRDLCVYKLGIAFDPWQDGAGRIILSKRADGKLAVMIGGVGMSLPRQVGKTYLLAAIVFALCILNPGFLVIWSAHHGKTHGETFLAMQAFADRPKVKPYIRQVFTGSGDEEIRFLNGSRILFGARERGFGRGIPGVDVIVSDEAQIMSEKALDAQLATMNTSLFGLAVFVGTPPRPEDPSEAFTRMRTEAWAGTLLDAAWIELGADPEASPSDRRQWAKANPSYPHRTPVESILRLQRKLKADSFLREGLGVWDDAASTVIDMAVWAALSDAGSQPADPFGVCFAVDMAPDRSSASIALGSVREDGLGHVELVENRPGTGWVAPRVAELVEKWTPCAVIVDAGSPAGALLPDLAALGVVTVNPSTREVGQACGALFDRSVESSFRHRPDGLLDSALRAAKKRTVGDAWMWDRRDLTDISPLVAATLALWGFSVHGGSAVPNIW